MKYFHGVTSENYNSGRDLKSLLAFMNAKTGMPREITGLLSVDAGRTPALDAVASKFLSATKTEQKSLKKEMDNLIENDA